MGGRSRSLNGQGGAHRKGGRRKPWVIEGGGIRKKGVGAWETPQGQGNLEEISAGAVSAKI